MMNDIHITLDKIYSLPVNESYILLLEIASQVETHLKRNRDVKTIELGKKVMEKLHGMRYLISSNKALDRADIDIKLEKAYMSLDSLTS